MNLTRRFLLGFIYSLLIVSTVSAQQKYYLQTVTDSLPINFENLYYLSHTPVLINSEIITLHEQALSSKDYTFNYFTSSFSLSDSLPYSILDTLIITYQIFRLSLKNEYKIRSLQLRIDKEKGDTLKIARIEESPLTTESIFGSGIQKSGTIVRGFTVGTTKDFTLNSGLRLEMSGRLSDEIEIVAALTDENTPIQPEGNTERLEELDKVFIQLKHPNAAGTFGDYQLVKRQGEFGVIDRKLQGLIGEFSFDNHTGYVSIAGSRGKFNSNNFFGIDGVQGPYRLSGQNNEKDIIIIAGSEKVFIDGIELKRGEANEYVIEYSNAQIIFTSKRLITSASRIAVDFEYTDRKYSRTFFGTGYSSDLFDNKLHIGFQYLREGDNQDAPIDFTLSDEDKKILSSAGDSRSGAVKSGVSLAEPDSLGIVRGAYQKADTLIAGELRSYYLYNPGSAESKYNVSFSYVGEGIGEYKKESLGRYTYVGPGSGSYSPVLFLPMPELKQFGNFVIKYLPYEDVALSIDLAGSSWDRNRFSELGDNDNNGYARTFLLSLKPKEISFGKINLGKAGFNYKDRFIQKKFTAVDRFNEVEFNRYYNLFPAGGAQDEVLREAGIILMPVNSIAFSSTYGFLSRGEDFKSKRSNNRIIVFEEKKFSIDYNLDFVNTKNIGLISDWYRHKSSASIQVSKLKPGLEFLAEDKRDKKPNTDSVLSGSLRYSELIPFITLSDLNGLSITAKYSIRADHLPLEGKLIKESKSQAQYYELNYSGVREINSNLNIVIRNKKYEDAFKQKGFNNSETILFRSQNRLNFFEGLFSGDVYYEASTQRSAKLEKVFIRVEKGTGNFKYLGDLNNNGIADENEFEPTLYDGDYIQLTIPTDELFPVIDLRTSTRWKIKLGEIIGKNGLLGSLLNPVSLETFWRVEENSREENLKKIYLLNFSSFQNERTTIRGSNLIQQDLFLFENSQELSFRLRYSQRKSLNQFSGGLERGYNRERSLRIRFRLVRELGSQTDIQFENDFVDAPLNSNRRRKITGQNVSTDFSYRPERNIEIGFKIRVGRKTDNYPLNPTVIDLNSQQVRLNLSFAGSGRLRAELERSELSVNTTQNFMPFELTDGNLTGKNYFWRVNFDYRITSFLQSTVSYDGRLQGSNRAVNTARAEVRAYF